MVQSLLTPRRYSAARVAVGRAIYWRYKLFQKKRHQNFVLEYMGGRPLLVAPGVLNPRLMRTGAFFASQLGADLIASDAEVLDMGTGSGVCAIRAAEHARHVVAVDINSAAVRCAYINALMNGLDHKIEVLQGDLFEPLAGRQFDVVLFNPPFLRGVPQSDADRAWRSTDVAERFAADLKQHLKPSGFALILLSTYGDASEFVRQFRRWNFDMAILAERGFVNERLTLLQIAAHAA